MCGTSSENEDTLMLKCYYGNCTTTSHVTCAMISGMSIDEKKRTLRCLRHASSNTPPQKFKVGDRLLLHAGGTGKRCVVTSMLTLT